jgi:hypothetical protein
VLLDRYKNGNGTNNAADDATATARMEEMNANQEKAEASMSASMKSNQDLLARLEARIETNRGKDGEDLKEMREEIKSDQAEMRSTLDEWLTDLKDGRKETTACNEATETKTDPALMQSTDEHQEILKGDAQ